MVRGGKVTGKRSLRKKVGSNKGSSDDSDEEYVVSDENRDSSDICSSLDGCASEDSFDDFIVDEEEGEFRRVRNSSRSKAKNGICGWRKSASNSRKRGRVIYGDQEEEEEREEEEEAEHEDEEEEFQSMRNANRSKAKNGICSWPRNASKNSRKRGRNIHVKQEEEEEESWEEEEEEEEEEDDNDDDEEEEFQGARAFNRSKAQNGVCGKQKNSSKTSRNSGWITHTEQLEEEEVEEEDEDEKKEEVERDVDVEELEEEEEKKEEDEEEKKEEVERDVDAEEVEVEKEEGDGDAKDEDFECDDEDEDADEDEDDEFTPEEEDFSDEEEEMSGRNKKNNGMKIGKKVRRKRASLVSTRGRKRRRSRASKKPLRRKAKSDSEDDFIDNDPAISTTGRKKLSRKRRRVHLSDSDCAPSGASDFEYTISEEEREQVREAKRLCGRLRNNLRSSSLTINDEEAGVNEDQPQQKKPPGLKGKEKIEESQGRKGKEKVEGLKSEVVKQVCGICLSEEDRRRVRGVLNSCTHYFCFACIMEWAKVESRCPVCKQRFKTISKPARSTKGVNTREMVIQVPERDQVYQPSEEELRSYIDPYESVICSECHHGGDDGLMLLCDVCDSPAHTYCVGLGREVPEGNWYCDGCRPIALATLSSQAQEADPLVTIQSLPVRPSPVHVRESIDLNLISSPRAALNQGSGPLSSSRFSGRSVEGASPVSGGAPTLSERRWIHRQIQQILSMDRMASTAGGTNGISAISSASNLYSSQIDQSRETATQLTRAEDVGTSYHTFFEERLRNNVSPLMQNEALWPRLLGTPPVPNYEQALQFSRSNFVPNVSSSPAVREESNFHLVQEQLQSMVTSHLKSLSQNIDLGQSASKEIARSSMHTILAACGLEHMQSEVCTVPPPSACPHIEMMAGGQSSLIKGCCSSCFDSFVGDVVKRILDTRISSQWLRLGL